MRKLAISSGDAFILVYSVDDPSSFELVKQIRASILEEREQLCAETTNPLSSSSICLGNNSENHQHSMELASSHSSLAQATSGQQARPPTSGHRPRLWSITALLSDYQNQRQQQQQQQQHYRLHQEGQGGAQRGCGGPSGNPAGHKKYSSVSSSLGYSSAHSSASSSADSSRRSSVSVAEAALKVRRTRHPPMVIVANKCDLPKGQHLVSSEQVEALALFDWNNGFVQASAKSNYNVNQIFQQLLRQAKQPPTLTEAIISKRRKSLPPKLPVNLAPA